eukprot:jgi/Ulvmu1/1963/UM012_0124.1
MRRGRYAEPDVLRVLRDATAIRLQVFRYHLSQMDQGPLEHLRACVERWTGLQGLSATGNVQHVLGVLCGCRGLRDLELSSEMLMTVRGIGEIPAVALLTGFTRLCLRSICCDNDAVDGLRQSVSVLTALRDVELTYMAKRFADDTGEAFAEAVRPLTQLTRLSLRYCRLGRAGSLRLAQGLACMASMHELTLEENRIEPEAFAAELVPVLGKMKGLSMLSVAKNPVGDVGAAALSAALPRMRALRALDMRHCSLTGAFSQAVVQAAPPGMRAITFQ